MACDDSLVATFCVTVIGGSGGLDIKICLVLRPREANSKRVLQGGRGGQGIPGTSSVNVI